MSQGLHTDTTSRKVPGTHWVFLGCIAILAPVIADGFHSFVVVSRGIRFYQAEFNYIGDGRYWLFLGIRAVIGFLVLWPFSKVPFLYRFSWICCVVIWTSLAYLGEAVVK